MFGTASKRELRYRLKRDAKKNWKNDPKATWNKMASWAYRLLSHPFQKFNMGSVPANVKESEKYTVALSFLIIRSPWQKHGTKNLPEEAMVGTLSISIRCHILMVDVTPEIYIICILNLGSSTATNRILLAAIALWMIKSTTPESISIIIIIRQTSILESRATLLDPMSNHIINLVWTTQIIQPSTFPNWINKIKEPRQTADKNGIIESASCPVNNNKA